MTTTRVIGVDIGGTKIAAGHVERSGLIGDVRVVATEAAAGARAVLERAIGLASSLVSEQPGDRPAAIGIATGGWVEPATGRIVGATDLLPGWPGTALRETFERELRMPAVALNDVHAMGIAEARLGAARTVSICLCVAVGTGIGGAIMIDGRLFSGSHGFAGGIGHICWRLGGPTCSCGRRGCIEAEASGPAIARAYAGCLRRRSASTQPRTATQATALPDVVDALGSSDERLRACALDAIATAGARLGRVLGGVANALDPDLIVLGGGAAAALGEPFLAAVRSGVADTVLAPIVVRVVPSGLGPSAGLVGAGLAALDAFPAGKSPG
jgi:glucokinase